MSQIRRIPGTLARDTSTTATVATTDSTAIVTVAWRYKDAAKEQARQGLISWATYRAYCAEVDRIKRARLTATRDALPVESSADVRELNQRSATTALMKRRHTGNVRDTHLDRPRGESGETRRTEIRTSLMAAPELSDREHARRIGCDHKTIALARRRLVESGEIPHFLRRADPRTGKLSQPSSRPAQRRSVLAWTSGVNA